MTPLVHVLRYRSSTTYCGRHQDKTVFFVSAAELTKPEWLCKTCKRVLEDDQEEHR